VDFRIVFGNYVELEPDLMESIDPVEIQKRVARRYRYRAGFLIHVAAYLGGSLFFWGIWLFTQIGILSSTSPSSRNLWPLIIMLGWGIALAFHGIGILIAPGFQESQERAIRRETEREMVRVYREDEEKPKRRAIRLADDGELVYEDEGSKQERSSQST